MQEVITLAEVLDQAAFILRDGAPMSLTELRDRLRDRYLINKDRVVYLSVDLPIRMLFKGDDRFAIEGQTIRLVPSSY